MLSVPQQLQPIKTSQLIFCREKKTDLRVSLKLKICNRASAMLFSAAKDLQQSNKQVDAQQKFPKNEWWTFPDSEREKTLVSAIFPSKAKELCH